MKNTNALTHIRELAIAKFETNMPHGSDIHGPSHWDMVGLTAAILLSANGHNPVIGHLFGSLHDCCREDDYGDPKHGERAAQFCTTIRDSLPLNDADFAGLYYACSVHNSGLTATEGSIVGCLCDADRIDLGRVGFSVNPIFLSTRHARDLLLDNVQRVDTPAGTLTTLWHGSDYLDGESRLQVTKRGVPVYLSERRNIASKYGRPHRILLATPGLIDLTDTMGLIHKPEFEILKAYEAELLSQDMTFRESGETFDLLRALEAGSMYHEDFTRGLTEELVLRLSALQPTVRMYDDSLAHYDDDSGEAVASWLTSCQTNTILLSEDDE